MIAFSLNLAIFFLATAIFPHVLALLCAFGCRELPEPQIVSSAQFRSFIMPRDVRLHGCVGCCGACGDGETGGEQTTEKSEDGAAGNAGEGALPEKPSTPILVGMNPPEEVEGKRHVWYSSPGTGESGHQNHYWRGRKLL